MTTTERLSRIEERQDRQDKIIKIIGKQMNDYDFDSLLEDIDEEVTQEETTKQPDEIDELDDLLEPEDIVPEPDNSISLDDLDDLADITEEEIKEETSEIDALKAEVKELKKQLEGTAPKTRAPNVNIDNFGGETKAYVKEMLDIDTRKKALVDETKAIKEDYKDRGVDIAATNRALSEIRKEMKETADEAQAIETTKEFLREDDSIVTTIHALNG